MPVADFSGNVFSCFFFFLSKNDDDKNLSIWFARNVSLFKVVNLYFCVKFALRCIRYCLHTQEPNLGFTRCCSYILNHAQVIFFYWASGALLL